MFHSSSVFFFECTRVLYCQCLVSTCFASSKWVVQAGSFLGELLRLSYPTIDTIVSAILSLGQGCMLYKHDLPKAYCQFPINTNDYHLLGYTWNSQSYFDTILTMCLHSATMACQHSMWAVTWILNQHRLNTFNYLINFMVFLCGFWLWLISTSLESCCISWD